MNLTVILLLLLAISMEVFREVSFKLASNQSVETHQRNYLRSLFFTPRVWIGFACWGGQIITWILILSRISLSTAFPILSLAYCGTIIASKYILHETISPKKWIAILFITMGVAIIGSQGVG